MKTLYNLEWWIGSQRREVIDTGLPLPVAKKKKADLKRTTHKVGKVIITKQNRQ